MRTFADAEARLAETLPGYESRPQQQALAQQVERSLASGEHLLAEAGCGTGKSLGYLIPAILSGNRTVVATATKALQDQIANKDLPFLSEHLGVDFKHAILKGRSNYFCFAKAADPEVSGNVSEVPVMLRTAEEREDDESFVGDRDQFPVEISDRDWSKVTTSADECPGATECAFGAPCLAQKAKRLAEEADVVVVNHALFLTDLVIRKKTDGHINMLGDYTAVIFDEAHEVEEYASGAFGDQFTVEGVRALTSQVRNFAQRCHDDGNVGEVEAHLLGAVQRLWDVMDASCVDCKGKGVRTIRNQVEDCRTCRRTGRTKTGRIRPENLLDHGDEYADVANALYDYADAIRKMAPGESETEKKKRLIRRASNMADKFSAVLTADFAKLVRWIENETMRNGDERRVLKYAPINIGDYLRPLIFGDDAEFHATAILVSATLEPDFTAKRLGIDEYGSMDAGTPFDFERQSILYVPADLPDPSRKRAEWESMSLDRMRSLVMASRGRALLLFTSRKQMRDAYNLLSTVLPFQCLMQGQRPNKRLAEEFMADESSVLFATRSFFTGVDFQGDACSLVVIDKLPFAVPTDALVEARSEAVEAAGGNAFNDFTIPTMTLVLKQGFGRLIRHRNDRGVVAILDPRLESKPYGKIIMRSLPSARRSTSISEVEAFFAEEVAA